ncbi:MAG: methyltransferase [Candidatus Methanomethylophilaceae archaeon]|nr:methyltransferase [Candidatus Methanomethylophilaceae archaeon]
MSASAYAVRMRKKDLEIALQGVKGFESPDPALEQYMTPATMAADIVFEAYRAGDVEGMKVVDLGCGTGMLSIACSLAGAGAVIGFDKSEDALRIAEANAESLGAVVDFRLCDVSDVEEGADTIVMNPPFGCQRRGADRPFLEKALELSECVYSIHMAETLGFVEGFCEKRGREIAYYKIYKYEIPHTFAFHTKMSKTVDVAVVNIR